jgi:hypothetical protein
MGCSTPPLLQHTTPWQLLAESLLGTALLLGWFVILSAALATEPGSDDAAGVGVVMITIPIWLLLAVILSGSGGAAAAIRRVRRGHTLLANN